MRSIGFATYKHKSFCMCLSKHEFVANVKCVDCFHRSTHSTPRTLSTQCDNHWCLIQLQATTIILLLEGAEKSTVLPKGIWDLQLRIKGLQRYKEHLSGFKTKCGRGIERESVWERGRAREVLLANHFEPSLRFMKSVCHELDDLSLGNWNQY